MGVTRTSRIPVLGGSRLRSLCGSLRHGWAVQVERWKERRGSEELRAQGSLIHLDLRLIPATLTLWGFTALALNRGTWAVLHPVACVLIGMLGCLAIALLAPGGGVDSRLAKARGPFLFRLTGQGVLVACVIVAQAVLLCVTGVDASRATLQQAQGRSIRLSGVVEQVRPVDPRTTLTVIRLEEVQGRSVRAAVNERVRVYTRAASSKASQDAKGAPGSGSRQVQPGTRVTAIGTVEFGEGPFTATARLRGTLFAQNNSLTGGNPGGPDPRGILTDLKERLRAHGREVLGADSAAIVLGTAYGDDSLMSATIREEYKLSGLSHLTAVSGANIALMFAAAYRLVLRVRPYRIATGYLRCRSWAERLRGLKGLQELRHGIAERGGARDRPTRRSGAGPRHSSAGHRRARIASTGLVPGGNLPPLVRRLSLLSVPRRVVVLCGIAAVLAYAMLLDSEGSVIRSLAMGLLGAYAMLRGSGRQSLAALQVTVLVCLLAAPHRALDAGFALSVTATAALILLGPPLARLFMRALPGFWAHALATPIVASLWCTPLILAMSGKVPLYAVPANLAAAPLAPVSMLAGLAALGFLAMGIEPLADLCLRVGGLAAAGIERIAVIAAQAPGNPWEPGSNLPAVLMSIAVVAGASALLWWADARRYRAVTHRRYLRVVARGTGENITGGKEATGAERI